MKRLSLTIFCLLFSYSSFANVFDAKEYFLDNGLHIVIVRNDKAPLVSQYVCYNAGRIDEEKGKSGVAHFLEHMFFKGNSFSEKIDELGGNDNAFTTNDKTCYYQSVSSSHLETIIKMESERMRGMIFSENDFNDEKKVIIEERLQRTDSKPYGVFNENMAKLFWEDTVYAVPTIGFMDEIKALDLSDLKDFYNKWYHPNNAVIAISGDVEIKDVKNLVKKYYKDIPLGNLPEKRVKGKDFNANYNSEYSLKHKNVNQDQLVIKYHVPSYHGTKDKKNVYALDVFSESIGSGTIGKLYNRLVREKKILLNVSAYYSMYQRLTGDFVITAVPAEGYDKKKVLEEIFKIVDEDLSKKEIDRVRKRMEIDMVYLSEKPLTGASLLAPLLVSGVKLKDAENYVKNLYSFNANELNKYKKELLQNPLIGWLHSYD